MAIQQNFIVNYSLYGDGVSTSYSVDIATKLAAVAVPPNTTPTLESVSSSVSISSSSLVGTILTLNFSSAPTGAFGVNATLLF